LRRVGQVSSRTDAFRARVIAEAERIHAAQREGFRSLTEWLAALTGEPVPVVRSQVAVAEALAQMPETKKAFSAGEVSQSRVKLLAQAQALAPEQFAQQEAALVAQVAAASSQQAPKVLAEWKDTTGPEAAEAEVQRLRGMRALHLSKGWSGMIHLSGDLDPEGGLVVLEALRPLSEGAALDPSDTRTPAQARADALVEICRRYLHADEKGKRRPARVLVTIPWDTLHDGKGILDTAAGPTSAGMARRLTCDATISRVLLDPESVPIDMGRATRVVPAPLRRLLELRDEGCTHPGCQMPARWCDAHHQQHWADGGKTELSKVARCCLKVSRDRTRWCCSEAAPQGSRFIRPGAGSSPVDGGGCR
jgi:hypothetical protein